MTVWRALLPVFGLLVNVLVGGFLARSGRSLLRSLFAGFAAGLAAVVFAARPDAALAGDLTAYAALGYCYFHFVNLGETARRIRLMRELDESPGGLSETELLARYGGKEILAARLGRLLANGQVAERGGRYFIGKPAMLMIARTITLLKLVVIGKRSEFDRR